MDLNFAITKPEILLSITKLILRLVCGDFAVKLYGITVEDLHTDKCDCMVLKQRTNQYQVYMRP